MKTKFNRTWFLVSLAIIANIFIFSFLSKKMESYVINDIVERSHEVDDLY